MAHCLVPCRLGVAWIVVIAFAACSPARADDNIVAGEWRVTFENGSVHNYSIDRHGRMSGMIGDTEVTGHAAMQNLYFTDLTLKGRTDFVRMWVEPDGKKLTVLFFKKKVGYPAEEPALNGSGVRQKDKPAASDPEPGAQISDLAGQWTIPYDNAACHIYEFDANGNMTGLANGVKWIGKVEEKAGRMLLTFNEVDKLERLTLRVDGRLAVEHWSPKTNFPVKGCDKFGVGTPTSGKMRRGAESLDAPMLACLEAIGCSAASVTVTRGDRTYFSRGYGWADAEHTVRMAASTPMCTGSCDKTMTAAMIRKLAREGKLDLDASVFKLLNITPAGKVVDDRIWKITVNHLLEHKAGWQGKPLETADQEYRAQSARGEAPGMDTIRSYESRLAWVMTRTLSWNPGSKAMYDSFGYGMLKFIVTKVSGTSYPDYLRHELLLPHGIKELKWVRHGQPLPGEPPRLWNGYIMEDPEQLRMDVSTGAMCTFMRYHWPDGQPRGSDLQSGSFWGGWTNCSTCMLWRGDGYNIAFSFNGRKAGDDGDIAEKELHRAVEWMQEEKIIPK